MANSKHLQWLVEGSDRWNERRRRNPFVPDLSGADFFEEFRENRKLDSESLIPIAGIDLSDADMTDTILANYIPLEGSRPIPIPAANLNEANLKNAKLCRARLTRANLIDANLDGADLSNADFSGADLAGADLSSAKLEGACLQGARLTNAVLYDTALWEAKIFTENPLNNESISESKRLENQNRCITCIEDLLKVCSTLNGQHANRVLYFRGECTNQWELRPSVMRQTNKGEFDFRVRESVMLRNLQSKRPADFLQVSSTFAEWVLAQHHRLPTRLLDVTRNPLVALFWACQESEQDEPRKPGRLHLFSVPPELVEPFNSDKTCVLANFAKLPLHHQEHLLGRTILPASIIRISTLRPYQNALENLYELIQQEKPYFKDRLDPRDLFRVFVVEPQQSFDRIRAQSGAFLISAYHERFEQKEIMNVNPETPIYDHFELEVPHDSKHSIMNDLRLLNISRETLLPGLDEAAKAVARGT